MAFMSTCRNVEFTQKPFISKANANKPNAFKTIKKREAVDKTLKTPLANYNTHFFINFVPSRNITTRVLLNSLSFATYSIEITCNGDQQFSKWSFPLY